jgi:hypothetical protein
VLHAVERAVQQPQADEGASHAAIAREAGLDRATTGAVMRALESRELVDGDAAFGSNAWAVLPTPLVEAVSASLARGDGEVAPTPPRRGRRRPSPSASE